MTKKFQFDKSRRVYERQNGESDKEFRAFVFYRDLGTLRNMYDAAEQYKNYIQSDSTIEGIRVSLYKWARKNEWRLRCEEWDREIDKRRRFSQLKAVEEMKDRHLKIAQAMQGLGTIELNKYHRLIKEKKEDDEVTLSVGELQSLILNGTKMERLNRDEPESKTEQVIKDKTREDLSTLLTDPDMADHVKAIRDRMVKNPEESDTDTDDDFDVEGLFDE